MFSEESCGEELAEETREDDDTQDDVVANER
jgi:hypothetical protein